MKYTFTIEVDVNGDVTEDEIKDYISFESGAICQLSLDNPFMDDDNDAEITNIVLY